MSSIRRIVSLLAISLALCMPFGVHAQQVIGVSEISYSASASEIDGWSETDMDYETAYYYDCYTEGYLFQDQTEMDAEPSDVTYPSSGVGTHSPFHQGSVYTVYSEHYLVAYNQYSEGTYYNPFQYPVGSYYFAPGDLGDQSGMGFAPGGGTVYVQTEFIYLGYTDVQVSTGPPAVTSISPQYDVPGASGTIHVQGHRLLDDFNYLNAYFRNDTDITASVNLNNASESQADVNYTISETPATMGAHQLYMQNTWGDSEPTTFKVVYPPATISGLSPGTWTAGQSYHGVQITGTNFGTTPTVVLSDPSIGISAPYNTSSGSGVSTTYVDISVPSTAPSEPVTVTLTPGSYTQVSGGPPLSASTTATVIGLQQNACPAMLDDHSGFSAIAPTGVAVGGSGSMTVSFSSGSFNGNSVTVPYGPYSTPESIASHLAALITKHYYASGLSAQAIGANVLYKSTSTLGSISITGAGSSFSGNPTPVACPPANLKYILAVLNDSVSWIDEGLNYGRQVIYNLENWPKGQNPGVWSLAQPSFRNAVITEHLTKCMAYGCSTSGNISGQFTDILGNNSGMNAGIYFSDRYFTVYADSQDLGRVATWDKAGTHATDHIEIHLPTGPSFLNNYKNSDGSPKNISLDN